MHLGLVQSDAEISKSVGGCMNDAKTGVKVAREFNSGRFNFFRGPLVKRGSSGDLNAVHTQPYKNREDKRAIKDTSNLKG